MGWDVPRLFGRALNYISIHPPRMGWDRVVGGQSKGQYQISIHPPRMGWDPPVFPDNPHILRFQSTHPAWGGTRKLWDCPQRISSDFNPPTPHGVGLFLFPPFFAPPNFNPPTPHGVGHDGRGIGEALFYHFNPPTPHGVGPIRKTPIRTLSTNFNPPTPHGVGRGANNGVSIRYGFQSTHPAWGGT